MEAEKGEEIVQRIIFLIFFTWQSLKSYQKENLLSFPLKYNYSNYFSREISIRRLPFFNIKKKSTVPHRRHVLFLCFHPTPTSLLNSVVCEWIKCDQKERQTPKTSALFHVLPWPFSFLLSQILAMMATKIIGQIYSLFEKNKTKHNIVSLAYYIYIWKYFIWFLT